MGGKKGSFSTSSPSAMPQWLAHDSQIRLEFIVGVMILNIGGDQNQKLVRRYLKGISGRRNTFLSFGVGWIRVLLEPGVSMTFLT